MHTLLIGSPDTCRDVLEALLRERGHDVHLAEDALAFCRRIRDREDRGAPIVLATAPTEEAQLDALVESDAVDELIFACEKTKQLKAQLALAEAHELTCHAVRWVEGEGSD